MKTYRIDQHGGPEVLRIVDVEEPIPGPDEVLVNVTHVGLNHLDVWVRRGVDSHPFPLPLVPGSDVVGIREDTGDRVALHPGFGCLKCEICKHGRHDLCRHYQIRGESINGGMAQRVVVPKTHLMPCPIEPAKAAAMPLSLLTAWHMLVGRARVRPGQKVLIQAGASGVGSLAIQVAKLHGAEVAVTASTERKRERCMELGADHAWTYEEAKTEVRSWTQKRGVDIVMDHVGEATWKQSVRALARGGTLVTCGATTGHQANIDLRVLFFKQLNLLGSTMGTMDEMQEAWAAVTTGAIRPVVDKIMPMTELAKAHTMLESRALAGKVVMEQNL
ncbi:MAG: alcohol dehydrogenase [Deltaproteobacteria bacterium]|nr:alcohol dehydrogenase [Deltaproteobacteria bacterium]MAY79634.1 alcohol dehydrogenase [Deltaproteobacteria bacterium]|tara:strand:- start:66 stop:1061 length:996 start_codon:yes stop_codon:yes gene_type:complete